MKRALSLVLTFVASAGSSTLFAQDTPSGFQLATLTVPGARLPSGCRLDPVDLNATRANRFVMYPGMHENPWVGAREDGSASTRSFASIRQVVEAFSGPDYGLRPGPARNARLAEDVVEAYRARYVAATRETIDVFAVTFRDPALAVHAAMVRLNTSPPTVPRIVFGSTAVHVTLTSPRSRRLFQNDPGADCLDAVRAHVEATKHATQPVNRLAQ